tara:strand:+ start:193 stop:387 length:195 start_codon:yes stop_codon:yes gene_type:complete
MKKIIPYIAFFCLTGFTATSGISVMASDCKSHINKKALVECEKNNPKCQTNKTEKYYLDQTVSS